MKKNRSWLSRTTLLIGEEAVDRLLTAHVMVVGLGGVGSYAAEFIARAGVGKMTIIDGDAVDPTNRNRQLPALATNHGELKATIMAERLQAINPDLTVTVIPSFINPEMVNELLASSPDYVIDAIDSLTPKITFLTSAYRSNIPIVSSMGAGGKLDPTRIQIADLAETFNCPFAQQVRKQLKQQHIYTGIKAVFSTEKPDKESLIYTEGTPFKKSAYGTISYLPATFGAVAASVVIRDLIKT